MDYGFFIVIGALYYAMYADNKYQREQINELRRVMDYQFDGLRHQFSEVKDVLKWVEPQVPGIGGHVAVRHTGLNSVGELIDAINSGRYHSALVPWTTLCPPVDEGHTRK
jgi:hypothetical protein